MFIISIACLAIIFIVAFLYILNKGKYKKQIEELNKKDYSLKALMPIGLAFLSLIHYKYNSKYDRKMIQKFNNLFGKRNALYKYKLFLAEKITLILLVLVIFSFLTCITFVQDYTTMEAFKNNRFERDEATNKKATVEITVKDDDKTVKKEVTVAIPKKDETMEEIHARLDAVEQDIKGALAHMTVIKKSMQLIGEHQGVTIKWLTSNPKIMDGEGTIYPENIEPEGNDITLTAKLTYKGETREVSKEVSVIPVIEEVVAGADEVMIQIVEDLKTGAYNEKDYVALPKEKESLSIKWKQIYSTDGIQIFVLGILAATVIFIIIDENVKKKQQKKNLIMQLRFPDMIAKFTLLINAGMTSYNAWYKVCEDYLRAKEDSGVEDPLYEEMVVALADMKSGIPEYMAYEEMGQRITVNEIKKFATILSQSIKRGNADLLIRLRQMSTDAWENRVSAAKRLGEEAATKLLFPMMILLLVIVAIVVAPAIMTMKM